MLLRFFLCKLILGFAFLCFSFVSIGLNSASAEVNIERDTILKMKNAYPTRDEYVYLPGFCRVKIEEMGSNDLSVRGKLSPQLAREKQVWVNKMGADTYHYSHHFCSGMNHIGRFERSLKMGFGSRNKPTKFQKATLAKAVGDFRMIEPPYLKFNSPLYAESVKLHAKALHLLGRMPEAIKKIKEGIAARPTSSTLYLYYAEILLESGNKAQAKKVLEWGYKRTNGSPKISKMLSGLN